MSEDPIDPLLVGSARDVLVQLHQAGLVAPDAALTAKLLRPREEDYEKAFDAATAPGLRAAYSEVWASGQMVVAPKPDQTGLLIAAATSDDLREWNYRARAFPGGYQDVARHLVPGRTWIRWKFVVPGEQLGMAYDGMVWCDDHWAWFPKPWRALRQFPPAIGEA